MLGVMVSAFSGAMDSLLTKLATLLEKDYKLLKDVKKDITSLRGEMSSMNTLLEKLSKVEELDKQDKEWRDKVRELAYDMEDCVDIFMNDFDRGGAEAWFAWFMHRLEIANRIKDLKARAVEISNCRDRYKFDERIVPPRAVAIDRRLLALHAEAASLVGVDRPKEELIKLLTKEEGILRLQVISIVGFGGIGKTTLANQVYTTIKRQYDCTALVSVSRNPDMVKILSDILSGVGCREYSSQDDVGKLIDRLREHLKDKRYLIVIDDIWTEKDWKIIEYCFVENNRGGRVITTTRHKHVAKACCSCSHKNVYQIKPLSDHDSMRLFHRRVFYSEDACPEQLNKVSNEIVQKCGGVPLAILCVASILSNREEVMSKESWDTIQNYLRSQLERNPRPTLESEWMSHVLNLSYNDLLHDQDLKTCMLYLGIFPEDYEIIKDDLMRRWIAEGFVRVEEDAESNFNELINRNIIQIARLDDCGEVMSCRVHDLMFDFIKSKSTEENFMSVINDQDSCKGSLKVRRLSPPPRNLGRLHVLCCPFSIVPDWITQLDKLSSLEVQILWLPRDGTEVLVGLPFLVHLRLHVQNVPEEGVVICGTWFRNLKEFWFRYEVPCLTFEAGAMPGLQSLEIVCNADGARQDDGVLTGIEHLGSLNVFKVDIHEPPRVPLTMDLVGPPTPVPCSARIDLSDFFKFCKVPRPHVEELGTWDRNSLEAALRKAINKTTSIRGVLMLALELCKIIARSSGGDGRKCGGQNGYIYIPIPRGRRNPE